MSDSVEDWPLSIVVGEAVGAPIVRAALTVTVTVAEVTVVGVLSVT